MTFTKWVNSYIPYDRMDIMIHFFFCSQNYKIPTAFIGIILLIHKWQSKKQPHLKWAKDSCDKYGTEFGRSNWLDIVEITWKLHLHVIQNEKNWPCFVCVCMCAIKRIARFRDQRFVVKNSWQVANYSNHVVIQSAFLRCVSLCVRRGRLRNRLFKFSVWTHTSLQ